jgi:cyclomaltodextrinase
MRLVPVFNFCMLLLLMALSACTAKKTAVEQKQTAFDKPPAWAQQAIWYQIFVERFRNGDLGNDPDLISTQGATEEPFPTDWSVTQWGHNWYAQEDWAKNTGRDFYSTIQQRRYGGDLKGVLEKLDYLEDLGINAIYFNPLNDAPSLHKYDARNYHHIDVNFGPNPAKDRKTIQAENPADTATWQWTTADTLFIHLLKEAHRRNLKVILDFSWNHTGRSFWAFQDVLKNQEASAYKDWYEIKQFDDPKTPENEFTYDGWVGIQALPAWKKINTGPKKAGKPFEGDLAPGVKSHIYAVTRRWMDPNGDGDFVDGIDGMSLDVAEHVPIGFWRDFRKYVRNINPEFYLVGENWWENWPDKLMDPSPWVNGDVFDAVMHYQWYKPTRGYFIGGPDALSKSEWQGAMKDLFGRYQEPTARAMMNVASSHDTPRLATSLNNKTKYKYKCKPFENPSYRTDYPLDDHWMLVKLFLLHQFTFVGSPHLFNGEELGMWGADDPDNRKPVWWRDYPYEVETPSPASDYNYLVKPRVRKDVLRQVKALTRLRKDHPALSSADFSFLDNPNERILLYVRENDQEKVLVVLNVQNQQATFTVPNEFKEALLVFGQPLDGTLTPYEGKVLVLDKK